MTIHILSTRNRNDLIRQIDKLNARIVSARISMQQGRQSEALKELIKAENSHDSWRFKKRYRTVLKEAFEDSVKREQMERRKK